MKIILQGIPKRKVKFDLAEKVMFLMFVILPTIMSTEQYKISVIA